MGWGYRGEEKFHQLQIEKAVWYAFVHKLVPIVCGGNNRHTLNIPYSEAEGVGFYCNTNGLSQIARPICLPFGRDSFENLALSEIMYRVVTGRE